MTTHFSCRHTSTSTDDGGYIKGIYATWEEIYYDEDGEQIAFCYGVLCADCVVLYGATECEIGGSHEHS